MTKEELQHIEDTKKLFKDVKRCLDHYNEDDAFGILNDIANNLNDFDADTNLSDLGDSLDVELNIYYVTDDILDELVKQRLDDTGSQGVACMLANYNGNYNLHYMNDYGNIEDDNLYEELKDLLETYKEEFERFL